VGQVVNLRPVDNRPVRILNETRKCHFAPVVKNFNQKTLVSFSAPMLSLTKFQLFMKGGSYWY